MQNLPENYIYGILNRGVILSHVINERNMHLDTRSCPFCKTHASINARFCKKMWQAFETE